MVWNFVFLTEKKWNICLHFCKSHLLLYFALCHFHLQRMTCIGSVLWCFDVRIISQDVTIAENMKNILLFTLLFQNWLVIELVTLKMGFHIHVHAHMLNYIECKPVRIKEKHEINIHLVKKWHFWSQNINMKNSLVYGVYHHFQQYFSYIMAVSFIGGANRRKPQTCRKSQTNFIT